MAGITIAVTGQALIHGAIAAPDAAVRDAFGADVAFANLEATAAVDGAWPTKTRTLHLTDPAGLGALRRLGLTAVGHANNHAFDLGPPGIAATREAVALAGLALAGSGGDASAAGRPAMLETLAGPVALLAADCGPQPEIVYAGPARAGINPLRMRRRIGLPAADRARLAAILAALGEDRRQAGRSAVGYQAAAPAEELDFFGVPIVEAAAPARLLAPEPGDLAAFLEAMAAARRAARLVLVALHHHHWDADWSAVPDWFLTLARTLVDHGADLVVGTGAPVLQPLAFHRGRPIFAGLGNLVFHTRRPDAYDRQGIPVWDGAICRCRFGEDGACRAVEVLPVDVGRAGTGGDHPAPQPLAGPRADAVLTRLAAGLPPEEQALLARLG